MKVWILGAAGTLGSHLQEVIQVPFLGTCQAQLDITQLESIDHFILSQHITHIINCAAYTLVDQAEEKKEKAYQINTLGPKHLGIVSQKYNIPVVHISTDYVFDGSSTTPYREDAVANPLNVYGFTKLQGENALFAETKHACVIRTSWLFGNYGNHFVNTMIQLMQEKDKLRIVDDQFGCPTYAKDLASILEKSLNLRGLYHFANRGHTNWYGFAKAIKKLGSHLPFKVRDIHPISSTEYQTKAKRPSYSILSTKKIEKTLQYTPRSWEEALTECMERTFAKTT